jgi:hypothetical protein
LSLAFILAGALSKKAKQLGCPLGIL